MATLTFRYAPMNAGKSTALLQAAHNYTELGMAVRLFTAEIDDREGVGNISSRLGVSKPAEVFNPETDFAQALRGAPPACVMIDEAQFLTPEQVIQLHQVAHLQGVPVVCYGLRVDFLGRPFPGGSYLMALADELEELKSVCRCKKKATMNARIGSDGRRETHGDQVEIGGNSRYRAMCPVCFYRSV